ncbi:hypothetical protein GDO78_001131 [Eleutherodactylus coqui]|uniref:Uncharacterized protein n=1 Tax=Eleutherodactylus coqui TaxID=57060 RepID=A0A8J6KIN7_ELECQ|nr:hypothetical protein GDO78_001131 [Eleutherodactylus coqui]
MLNPAAGIPHAGSDLPLCRRSKAICNDSFCVYLSQFLKRCGICWRYTSKVHAISAGITFFLSGLLFVPVVGSMVWDYSATVTFVHVIACCAVTQEFPLMWQWWLQIGCGLFVMITCGQTLAYFTCRSSNQRHRLTN